VGSRRRHIFPTASGQEATAKPIFVGGPQREHIFRENANGWFYLSRCKEIKLNN